MNEQKAKKKKNLVPMLCNECDKVFMGGPYTYLCPDCRYARLVKGQREWREKRDKNKK